MMNVFRASTSQSLTPSCLLVLRPFVGRCQISTVKLTTSLIYTFSSRPANTLSFTQVQVFLFCFISLLNNRSKQTTTYQPLDLGLLSTSYSNKAFNPYNNTMSQETHCFCHRQGNGGRKVKGLSQGHFAGVWVQAARFWDGLASCTDAERKLEEPRKTHHSLPSHSHQWRGSQTSVLCGNIFKVSTHRNGCPRAWLVSSVLLSCLVLREMLVGPFHRHQTVTQGQGRSQWRSPCSDVHTTSMTVSLDWRYRQLVVSHLERVTTEPGPLQET